MTRVSSSCVVSRCTDGICIIFVDWASGIDGAPSLPREAWWEDDVLCVRQAGSAVPPRRVPHLQPSREWIWALCAPGGILAAHNLFPSTA